MNKESLHESLSNSLRALDNFKTRVEKVLKDANIPITCVILQSEKHMMLMVVLKNPRDRISAIEALGKYFSYLKVLEPEEVYPTIIDYEIILTKEPDPFEEKCIEMMKNL